MISAADLLETARSFKWFKCGHPRTPANSYSNGMSRKGVPNKARCKICTSAREKEALQRSKQSKKRDTGTQWT